MIKNFYKNKFSLRNYTPTPTQYCNIIIESDDDDDDKTVIISNRSTTGKEADTATTDSASTNSSLSSDEDWRAPQRVRTTPQRVDILPTTSSNSEKAEAAYHLSTNTFSKDGGVGDSGATSHFVLPGTPVINVRKAVDPLVIYMPDGKKIQSTHTCELDVPNLPEAARQAHIVPGLAHTSLISIKILCDAGCRVVFEKAYCRVYYQHKIVWTGHREPNTGLWVLPMRNTNNNTASSKMDTELIQAATEQANNAYQMTSKGSLIKYLHQCLFSPPKATLLKAIKNKQFTSWPGLTEKAVQAYLPQSSPATDKGHMKRIRKGIRSTQTRKETEQEVREQAEDMNPAKEANDYNHLFAFVGSYDPKDGSMYIRDEKDGRIYIDMTGNFPVQSYSGMTHMFVLYDYTTNAIIVRPLKNDKSESIIDAFKSALQYLTNKGFRPKLNIMDNVASKMIKEFLEKEKIDLQLVPPHDHRANAAERAIQTFKNHFISGLCTTDNKFPLQLWDVLLIQGQDSLNMLRTSRAHPHLSAYHILEGAHDFNRTPWAPPGTRATVFNPPETRTSWGTRAVDAFYVGPAKDHYRCYQFYVPETRGFRTSGQATFYPEHCDVPHETPMDAAVKLAHKLTNAIRTLNAKHNLPPGRHATALEQLAGIFQQEATQDVQPQQTQHQTSTNPTAPRQIQQAPRRHQRVTRNNTPGIDIAEPPQQPPKRRRMSPRLNQATPLHPTPEQELEIEEPIITVTKEFHPTPNFRGGNIISQEAVNLITQETWRAPEIYAPRKFHQRNTKSNNASLNIEQFCMPAIHPITKESITSYKKLVEDPITKEIWSIGFGKEFGNMAQGDDYTKTPGTDSIFVIAPENIKNIPKDRVITYARIVVDFRPQKPDPNRVRMTAGGNLIKYPGELTTRTADLSTSKIIWNSVLSTENAKYMCMDVKNFYLGTPLDRYEYMRIPLAHFPEHTIQQYKLRENQKNGFIYVEIRKAIYGLPQGGILANEQLKKFLAPAGYFEVPHTPGLFKHITRPIAFSLVVDDFGVKYTNKADADHLLQTLEKHYTAVATDWTGGLYCGITLKWDYTARTLDISMPGYVEALLVKYKHECTKKTHTPYKPAPRKFGKEAQDPLPEDTSPALDDKGINRIQQIVGSILFYARAVDLTNLPGLNTLASEQTTATETTMANAKGMLDYLATHPNATIRYRASDMILNVHSDASYLSESRARSRAAGYFFLGSVPEDGKPIKLNGAIHTLCSFLKFVASSAAEAELGALFMNAKEAKVLRLTLQELGHPQPPTPIHCDNNTATGIANNTVKRQRSRSMEMRYFWIADQVSAGYFDVRWHPGLENLADYLSKHFDGMHHQNARPYYLHEHNSPLELPRAPKPSTLRGCVGTKQGTYVRGRPMPSIVPTFRALVPPVA